MPENGFKLENIHYNPARRAFEAVAARILDGDEQRLACSFYAPISTGHAEAIRGLIHDADRQIHHRPRLVMVHRPAAQAPVLHRAA
ncbi:hypothetical protein VK792_00420 [Mesobacterium sp. TK19101]|uniref:Uncharacterized protein n=1 Tax=Mesobacterium hydrothermale TaxID=3111907 RepID=A0ABU6HCM0_9RHOB|nr:hypothetical protein [Mesobacterium sp. TK19101]MEC3859731.1 hypothetical protein [Mesobacterium sp. TK19101]